MNQKKLFVGNLPFSSTEDDIREAFAGFGDLEEVRLITDRESGRSRGFAFVTFASASDAESALSLDGQALGGRRVAVNFAKEREPREPR
ncbi:MAG: RNA-binding protein [Gammaproteobacteria bacterium]|nr:RNA-binding protein [Gammaproteobacteria bacterium]